MLAEERYTWVTELAVHVGETTAGVPLQWRGCGRAVWTSWIESALMPLPLLECKKEESENDRRGGDSGEGVPTEA